MDELFRREVARIRASEDELRGRPASYFEANRVEMVRIVETISTRQETTRARAIQTSDAGTPGHEVVVS